MSTIFKSITDFLAPQTGGHATPQKRLESVLGSARARLAADLLIAPSALIQLSLKEARVVVSYMFPKKFAADTVFIKEGDTEDTDHMLLVLEGDVVVEHVEISRAAPVTLRVMGPGSLIGEMGLLDNAPRSASCTASTDVRCAVLTHDALVCMIRENPRVGAKFMMAVATRLAERVRDVEHKLKLYARLTDALQAEIIKQP